MNCCSNNVVYLFAGKTCFKQYTGSTESFWSRFNNYIRWSFDGAEIWEIVGLYLLDKLSNLLGNENVGLYRDNSLAAINSCSSPILDRTRTNIIALFKEEGLSIIIETNLVETNFLDVTFNLVTETHIVNQTAILYTSMPNQTISSNIIEGIKAVLFYFFFSRKDFTRTKSTKTHISKQKQKRQF